jgi:hypothetical protein
MKSAADAPTLFEDRAGADLVFTPGTLAKVESPHVVRVFELGALRGAEGHPVPFTS